MLAQFASVTKVFMHGFMPLSTISRGRIRLHLLKRRVWFLFWSEVVFVSSLVKGIVSNAALLRSTSETQVYHHCSSSLEVYSSGRHPTWNNFGWMVYRFLLSRFAFWLFVLALCQPTYPKLPPAVCGCSYINLLDDLGRTQGEILQVICPNISPS